MLIKQQDTTAPKSFEIPSETDYFSRRDWLKKMGYLGLGAVALTQSSALFAAPSWQDQLQNKLANMSIARTFSDCVLC